MSASEVARLRAQIERECEASWQALYGLAAGLAQHEFISARMQQMDACHQRLGELLGEEQATALLCETFNRVGETFAPEPSSGTLPVSDTRSVARHTLRKVVLTQEEM